MTSKFIYNKLLANALLCAELKSVLTILIFVYWKKVSQVGAPVVEVSMQWILDMEALVEEVTTFLRMKHFDTFGESNTVRFHIL